MFNVTYNLDLKKQHFGKKRILIKQFDVEIYISKLCNEMK